MSLFFAKSDGYSSSFSLHISELEELLNRNEIFFLASTGGCCLQFYATKPSSSIPIKKLWAGSHIKNTLSPVQHPCSVQLERPQTRKSLCRSWGKCIVFKRRRGPISRWHYQKVKSVKHACDSALEEKPPHPIIHVSSHSPVLSTRSRYILPYLVLRVLTTKADSSVLEATSEYCEFQDSAIFKFV